MVLMVPYEAFACRCGAGDVVLRESYKHETRGKLYYACPRSKPRENTFGCKFFLWKEERVRLLVGSPGASTTPIYSPGSSSTPIYSPGSSTPPRYSPGASTPPSYSLGTSRNAECSNCKHLLDKITVLEATIPILTTAVITAIHRRLTRVYALQLQTNDAGMATLDESFGKNEAAIAAVEETTQDHE
ncbi:hypothetical protein Tco_1071150 [Tanacetum coccineum]|uniref:GRF-type domain-containing protein n=1 Tax=Tanacetum coccineum TaxID=301880 RepID=A0ABQ5HNG3_9ASTR